MPTYVRTRSTLSYYVFPCYNIAISMLLAGNFSKPYLAILDGITMGGVS